MSEEISKTKALYSPSKEAEAVKVELEKTPTTFDWQYAARPRKIMFAGDDIPMAWKNPPNKHGSLLKKGKEKN